jgi:hypothetical protein
MVATLRGQFVATPVQSLLATGAGFISSLYKDGTDQVLVRDYVTMQGNLMGDVISLCVLKSTALIDPYRSWIVNDACGASVRLRVGDVNFPTAGLVSPIGLTAAGRATPFKGVAQRLWQWLGYASDPGGNIELLGTIIGANPTDGASIGWAFFGRNL